MQGRLRYPPLNSVRAFEAAARLGSLKAAAADLGVTASAVSHQVKQLEEEMGKRLFIRRNNSLELTRDGRRFFDEIGPALKLIAHAAETVARGFDVVAMNVSASIAQLWLIPRLADFHRRNPRISIDMETARRPIVLDEGCDLTITFSRDGAPTADAIHLLADWAAPMASPEFLQTRSRPLRIQDMPLISSTPDGWEWQHWASTNGIDGSQLRVAFRFDTDCAAIAACAAGVGVTLAPACFTLKERDAGLLVRFGDYADQEFGDYWIAPAPRLRRSARIFVSWLQATARTTKPPVSRSNGMPVELASHIAGDRATAVKDASAEG
jgi:LysR family transcriptional regulator, glycine cleavage system transcriptional activator